VSSDHYHYGYADERHDHGGQYAEDRHDHDGDYAEKHHRHYDDERETEALRRELRDYRQALNEYERDLADARRRIRQLEQQTPQARHLQLEADQAAADLAESGYDRTLLLQVPSRVQVPDHRPARRRRQPHPGRRGGGEPVKIRLHGTEDECREAAGRLAAVLEVLAVSEPYPDRGASVLVRVDVDARVAPPVHVTSATEPRPRGRRRALPPGGAR
jgi:hypothetical protein